MDPLRYALGSAAGAAVQTGVNLADCEFSASCEVGPRYEPDSGDLERSLPREPVALGVAAVA
jgi:hypothetical protein